MIYQEKQLEEGCLQTVLNLISGVIKTAPKSRGLNALKTLVVTGEEKDQIAVEMKKYDRPAFQRDSQNIKESDAVILIGAQTIPVGLDCGMCGHTDCAESKKEKGLCIFNIIDLGIALGSAASSAQIFKIDNRIMYTAAYAARAMGLFEKEYNIIMSIPLKISQKNIFFDRK